MSGVKTTAVIVTHQSRATIGASMMVAREAHAAGVLDCVVVDNDSDDGTLEYLRAEHSWATIVASPENLGYARGCNVGLQSIESRFVLLLNPDATLTASALAKLVGFMEQRPKAGIVGPAIRRPGGRLQVCGGLPTPLRIILGAARICRACDKRRVLPPGSEPFRTDWLSGAVLLVRRSLLDSLVGLDPRFFLYFEETDLCRRALDRGWEIWASGEAVAWHSGGASTRRDQALMYSGCIAAHYFRSRFYYLVKHYRWPIAACTELTELVLIALRSLALRVCGRTGGDLAVRVRSPIFRQPARSSLECHRDLS